MWSDEYQLIDFGDGRKLERFGGYVLDRPSPAAEPFTRRNPAAWREVAARFEKTSDERGQWLPAGGLPPTWLVDAGLFRLELKPTPFGHLGIFPEQAANWRWLHDQVRRGEQPPRVLNLFAYTGASTLAAALAGAQVVHVDSARNTVAWARRNAELSGLAEAPIRWIVEDALRFVRRELKRGNTYDAVILDPPGFGRGPKGETWKLERDLPELLELCRELTAGRRRLMLLSCHTPGYDESKLRSLLAQSASAAPAPEIESGPLALIDPSGRELPSGFMARLR